MATNLEKMLKEALQVVQDRDKIKKEINALIIVREDIKMNTAKEQKKANTEMEEFKNLRTQEINKLLDQKSSLEEELFGLKAQIKASKGSITTFDKEINDLKIQVRQLTLERNGLQEEKDGLDAHLKQVTSKYNG